MAATFKIECPACRASIRAPLSVAGTKTVCPGCGQRILVPDQRNKTMIAEAAEVVVATPVEASARPRPQNAILVSRRPRQKPMRLFGGPFWAAMSLAGLVIVAAILLRRPQRVVEAEPLAVVAEVPKITEAKPEKVRKKEPFPIVVDAPAPPPPAKRAVEAKESPVAPPAMPPKAALPDSFDPTDQAASIRWLKKISERLKDALQEANRKSNSAIWSAAVEKANEEIEAAMIGKTIKWSMPISHVTDEGVGVVSSNRNDAVIISCPIATTKDRAWLQMRQKGDIVTITARVVRVDVNAFLQGRIYVHLEDARVAPQEGSP